MNRKILLLQSRGKENEAISKIEARIIFDGVSLEGDIIDIKNTITDDLSKLDISGYSHVIMPGSNLNISEGELGWFNDIKRIIKDCDQNNIPFLGICFGSQFLAYTYGAKIKKNKKKMEMGAEKIKSFNTKGTFFEFLPETFMANLIHMDFIYDLSKEFINLGSSKKCPNQILIHKSKPLFGVQFHPEHGKKSVKEYLGVYENLDEYFNKSEYQKIMDAMIDHDKKIKSIIPRFLEI